MLRINYRPKLQREGNNPYLYCRIRLNGLVATDFSIGMVCTDNWDQTLQRFRGKSRMVGLLNAQIETLSNDIRELLADLKRTNPTVTASQLRNAYVKQEKQTLLYLYQEHDRDFASRRGQPGYGESTFKMHSNLHKNMVKYLKDNGRKDIRLIEINLAFGRDYVRHMREQWRFGQNHIVRNINHLQKLLDGAVLDELLPKNPLAKILEKKTPPGPVEYLTCAEVSLLTESPLLTPGQQRVADAFLFVCKTGLAYCDLAMFRSDRDITIVNSRRVTIVHRNKSTTPCFIPLFAEAERLLRKYDGQIPVISNQKMNEVLKEIALAVGITKHMTTHLARKTAGTYLLNNDVPMGTVSKILGHRSILTTEKIYAHLLDETVLRHTEHLV